MTEDELVARMASKLEVLKEIKLWWIETYGPCAWTRQPPAVDGGA